MNSLILKSALPKVIVRTPRPTPAPVVVKESPGGKKRPKDQPLILGVDFDGRIAENREDRDLDKTKPRDGCKEAMDRLKAAGIHLIVWTARPDTDEVEVWLKRNKIPFDDINENSLFDSGSRKIYCDMYIDDRGEGDPDAEWDDLLPEIADRLFENTCQPISKYDGYDELEGLADKGIHELEGMLVDALGFPVIHITEKLRLGELEAELTKPGGHIVIAPVKKKKRAKEKVESDYDGDYRHLMDFVRGSVAVDSLSEVFSAYNKVRKNGGLAVRLPKDRFREPLSNGYRDYLVNYRLPCGMVCEVQYHLKPVLIAREREKVAYDVVRAIRASMEEEGREEMTPAEAEACRRARKASESIYARAWEESGEGQGPDHDTDQPRIDPSPLSPQTPAQLVETFYRCPYCNGSRATPNGPRPSDGQLVSGGNAGTEAANQKNDIWRAGEETSTLSSRVIQESATCPDCKMTFSIAGRNDLIVKMLLARYVAKRTRIGNHRERPPRDRGHQTSGPPPRPRPTPPENAGEEQRAILQKAQGQACVQGERADKTGCTPQGPSSGLPGGGKKPTVTPQPSSNYKAAVKEVLDHIGGIKNSKDTQRLFKILEGAGYSNRKLIGDILEGGEQAPTPTPPVVKPQQARETVPSPAPSVEEGNPEHLASKAESLANQLDQEYNSDKSKFTPAHGSMPARFRQVARVLTAGVGRKPAVQNAPGVLIDATPYENVPGSYGKEMSGMIGAALNKLSPQDKERLRGEVRQRSERGQPVGPALRGLLEKNGRRVVTKGKGAPCERGETAAKTGCIPQGPVSAVPLPPKSNSDTLADSAVLNRPASPWKREGDTPAEEEPTLGPVGKRNHTLITQGLQRANITTDRKELYAKAMRRVMERMPEAAHKRIGNNLNEVHFFQNVREVTLEAWDKFQEDEERADIEEQMRNHYGRVEPNTVKIILRNRKSAYLRSVAVGGFYTLSEKSLRFDGESPNGEIGMGRPRNMMAEHIYSHELTHAIDGAESELSLNREWFDAGEEEILRTDNLTQYAKTNAHEAFAEFGRLLYAGDIPLDEVERTFPKCSAYFKKLNLWPE